MKKLIFIAAMLIAQVSLAQIPKPLKNTYVNDFAKVLTLEDKKSLNTSLHRIERTSGVQVAIVLINKLPADYDIESYALLIGRKWHVGKQKNGLVYVAAISQHKQHIEVAKMLTDKFPDERCAAILDGIKPYFKQSDYSGGLTYMVSELTDELVPAQQHKAAPATAAEQAATTAAPQKKDKVINILANIIAAIIFLSIPALVIFFLVRIFRRRRASYMYTQQPGVYNNGYPSGYMPPNGGYPSGYMPPNGNYPPQNGSRVGAAVGGFAAGAAAGYIARGVMNQHNHQGNPNYPDNSNNQNYPNSPDPSYNSSDNDSNDWGDWGGGGGDSSFGSSSFSSSDSGFDGNSGSTSDW